MTRSVSIRLLGPPGIYAGGQPVDASASRMLPIVALLAVARERVPRERIAALLWRRVEASSALASLRQVLHHFPEALRAAITADRTAVALDADAADCDLWRLQHALATDASAAGLLELYRGAFLGDDTFDDLPEFDDWVRGERARFAGLVRGRVLAEATRLREGGSPGTAMATARAWIEREPADEAMHAELLRAQIAAGDPGGAEAQFEALRRVLATTAGRSPAPATREILERALRARPSLRGANVPALATSFVGRQEELAELARLASDPHCRLITLHGPGGVGKTRIALSFADETLRHGDAACFVGLEAAHTAQGLYAAIAAAYGLELSPKGNATEVLCKALALNDGLLVLDNFEQLLPADGEPCEAKLFLPELLRSAPRLKILVTTRTTLGLQEEWLVAVGGLSYPAADADARVSVPEAAVELFTSRARQAYRGFSPAAELPHILAICRAADGLPLALELAAAQVGQRPCADIARNLLAEEGSRRAGNRPERQASVRRVLEQSLAAASAEQVRAFASLALFQGVFDAALAFAVARVTEGTLQELGGRALLQRVEGGFRMHPLLRELAVARLARSRPLAARIEGGYAVEIGKRAEQHAQRILGPDVRAAVAGVPLRFADELQAFRLACAHGDGASAVRLADSLYVTALARGLMRACLEAWPAQWEALEAEFRGTLLLVHAGMRRHSGDYDGADDDYAQAERLCDAAPPGAPWAADLRVRIEIGRSGVRIFRGDYAQIIAGAERLQAGGLEAATFRDRVVYASVVATAYAEVGEYARAREAMAPSLREAEARQVSALLMVYPLNSLGGIADYEGDFRRCCEIHEQAIALLERDGLDRMKAPHLCNLGGARLALGDPEAAEPAFAQAIEIAVRFGDKGPHAFSQVGLANAALARGALELAATRGAQALAIARQIGSWALAAEANGALVRTALRAGNPARAREILAATRAEMGDKLEGFRKIEVAFLELCAAREAGEAHPGDRARAEALQADPGCTEALRREINAWAGTAAIAAE
jgi:DNA-binding SARP family transcriptional activator/predicted ATPase